MPKPFDAVAKRLIGLRPGDWLRLMGAEMGAVEKGEVSVEPLDLASIDTDLSTISAQADCVLRVQSAADPEHPHIEHVELETGHHGANRPRGLLRYNVLLTDRYDLPVRTTLFLLRREADSPALTGTIEYRYPTDDAPYLTFRYNVVRVWRLPVEAVLSGGIGTLPLAPITLGAATRLPEIIQAMEARFTAETSPEEQKELWVSTRILMGLKYSRNKTDQILKGVRRMRDSVTYMEIWEEGEARGKAEGKAEGKADEARRLLLRAGTRRLGAPSASVQERIATISDAEHLEQLFDQVFETESWSELFSS